STTATTDQEAIDWWMQAPFHALGMMDPRLTQTAFGSYREVKSGWDMGAGVDVLRGNSFSGGQYPVYFPGNGSTEPLTSYDGNEFPDPLQACSGYTAPTGLPVFIEVGGNVPTTASPTHSFTGNGVPLAHCIIDSTVPSVGSSLTSRGAVIVIPRAPLQSGVKYVVAVNVNSVNYTWSFTVGPFWGITGVAPGFGAPAGGTAVTINGSGFTGATGVKFGTTAATSFNVANDTTITAMSPAHVVGAVDIGVTTPTGTSATSSADLFVYATPCTVITGAATPASPAAPGTQVTITGTATCPDANPLYEFWMQPSGSSTWQLVQGYSTSNAYQWNSTGALSGTETFGVWVRDATSTGALAGTELFGVWARDLSSSAAYDTFASIPFSISGGTCTSVTASAAPTTVAHGTGARVTITGVGVGCTNAVYEFWMRAASQSAWQLVQGYTTSGSYSWNTTGAAPGSVYFGIWIKDSSSSAAYEQLANTIVTVS